MTKSVGCVLFIINQHFCRFKTLVYELPVDFDDVVLVQRRLLSNNIKFVFARI